ncbi:hypothetical protein TNCV_408501 [Trichonephila clavipes]|nr:hypothetical protein TNCV_408501 [Trichonephila clavipes]
MGSLVIILVPPCAVITPQGGRAPQFEKRCIKGSENISLKGCTTTNIRNFLQKSSRMSDNGDNTPVRVTPLVQPPSEVLITQSAAGYTNSTSNNSSFECEFILLPREMDGKRQLPAASLFTKPSVQTARRDLPERGVMKMMIEYWVAGIESLRSTDVKNSTQRHYSGPLDDFWS